MRLSLFALSLLLGSAAAQDPVAAPAVDAAADADTVRALLDLPARAQSLRDKGVAPGEVADTLKAAHEAKLRGRELADVLGVADQAAGEHGAVEGMGAFVRQALAEGKRGQELAAAIHAGHAERGRGAGGPPEGRGPGAGGPAAGKGAGPGAGKGPGGDAGAPRDGTRGGPADDKGAGRTGTRGETPDAGAGRAGTRGAPAETPAPAPEATPSRTGSRGGSR
jgi:hypothetical protein